MATRLHEATTRRLRKILCPIDFSPGSSDALHVAARIAVDHGSELVLLHAWYLPPIIFAGEFSYPTDLVRAIERALAKRRLEVARQRYQESLEERVEEKTAELSHALCEVQESYSSTLDALVGALDAREHETGGHSQRVVRFTLAITDEMGISRDRADIAGEEELLEGLVVLRRKRAAEGSQAVPEKAPSPGRNPAPDPLLAHAETAFLDCWGWTSRRLTETRLERPLSSRWMP